MSRHVCKIFNSLYSQLPDDDNEEMRKSDKYSLYKTYCPINENGHQECNSNSEHISAAFVYLVLQLFGNVDSDVEHEDQKSRYVYYGFLWMSYKLQQSNRNSGNSITLFEFINDNVLKDQWYEVVKEYVDHKVPLITKETDIGLMSEIYYILKEMCKFFSINNHSLDLFEDFSKYYDSVIKCGEKTLKKSNNGDINNVDINNVDQIYLDLYDMLKNVYNDYRDYHYIKNSQGNAPPELPDIKEIKKNVTQDLKTSDSKKPDPPPKPQPQPPEPPQSQNGTSSQTSQMEDSDKGKKNTDGTNGNKKDPIDPASSTLGGYFDWWSSFHESLFDRTEIFNKSFQFIDKGRQKVKEVTNKISDAYTNTVDIVKGAYDSTVNNINYAYTTSTNYISGAASNITNQLSSLSFFSQLGDDQSGSGSSGNSLPTDNNPTSTTQTPNSDKKSPSLPSSSTPPVTIPSPSPSTLQSTLPPSPPSIPQLSQTPSDPQDPSGPSPPESIDPQPIPTPIHQTATTDGNKASQTSSSGQGTLSSSSTDPSTQGNGSTTVTVVKMNEKPSIWCIGSNNKCDVTGISIIVISISIILTIMYKYLSLGCTSKSKRKKSVKKVINSIGGKIPIQIIIKSYDRSKDLKPVINSGDRKKTGIAVNLVNGKIPLLNIYKLMQADPIPFINLFFLLIFFVYKRRRNYLEL
ncbi:CIR protein PIR protein [Plasmodium vinckei brucechwatti]|uniref:CIR protein PIR protein n=1 Tax=Plasmodium vinckei brucechwatti TaxID=119398 RepID=A0A6V7S0B9_PLAVN|nr:CIR protein PIR protein [Plasmodium vinckei brucechwatti]